jgi:hypothetical protein
MIDRMAILQVHLDFYREIFEIPGFVAEPFLMIGFQVIAGDDLPEDFNYENLKQLLNARGVTEVTALDLFDARAELRYDLNVPVPSAEVERYRTVCDIGTLEHLFDTRQCIENCMRMVEPGGRYCLVTPVKGWYRHGLHTFDPELVIQAFQLNGFEIEYLKYSSKIGKLIETPEVARNALIWIVGRKTASLEAFQVPQQGRWAHLYP